jgi:hypothetical protein
MAAALEKEARRLLDERTGATRNLNEEHPKQLRIAGGGCVHQNTACTSEVPGGVQNQPICLIISAPRGV